MNLSKLTDSLPKHKLGQLSIYLSNTLFQRGLPFLALPLFTTILSPKQYGLWSLFLSFITLLTPITSLSLPTYIASCFYKRTEKERYPLIFNALLLDILSAILLFLLIYVVSLFKAHWFTIPTPILFLLPVASLGQNIQDVLSERYRLEEKAWLYAALTSGTALVKIIISLLLLYTINKNWTSLVYGMLIGFLVSCAWGIYHLLREKSELIAISTKEIKQALPIILPLVLQGLGMAVIGYSDRFILSFLKGAHEVGIYSIAASIGRIVLVLNIPLSNLFAPWFFKNINNATTEKKAKIVAYTYLFMGLIIVLAFLISLLGLTYVTYFLPKGYQASAIIIPWITASSAIFCAGTLLTNYLIHLHKTSTLAVLTLSMVIIHILLAFILIYHLGMLGAALATLATYTFYFIGISIITQRHFPMPWLRALNRIH